MRCSDRPTPTVRPNHHRGAHTQFASGNELVVRNEGTGTFVISDIVISYKADV